MLKRIGLVLLGVIGGELAIFEESAHAPHYEEPDRFCEVIAGFARRST